MRAWGNKMYEDQINVGVEEPASAESPRARWDLDAYRVSAAPPQGASPQDASQQDASPQGESPQHAPEKPARLEADQKGETSIPRRPSRIIPAAIVGAGIALLAVAVTFDTHVAQVDFSAFRPAAALAAVDTPDARAPDARPTAPQAAGELQACHDTYTVVRGDTLSTIASRTYRDGSRPRYMAIFSANQDRLREPDLVVVGEELRIPCP